jgi:hypothetical protein
VPGDRIPVVIRVFPHLKAGTEAPPLRGSAAAEIGLFPFSPFSGLLSIQFSPGVYPRATPETRIAISNQFAISTVVALRATAGHGGTRAR